MTSRKMQTNNETRSDDLVKELASDYASYLVVDSSAEVFAFYPNKTTFRVIKFSFFHSS